MAINLRSPYHIGTIQPNAAYGTLDISIWEGNYQASGTITAQYNLRKKVIGTSPNIFFEISELIRDYIDITFDGDYTGQAVWVKLVQTVFDASNNIIFDNSFIQIAFDGYWYFEEQQTAIPSILISNREIFVLDDTPFTIPIYSDNNPTVVFYKDGAAVSTETFTSINESSGQIRYVSSFGDSYQERVLNAGGTLEDSSCLQSFFNKYSVGGVDKITVTDGNGTETIKVNTIQECKYDPKKITFVNKLGALQDMYFFKKSVEKMTVKKESYKANIISSFGTYDKSNHVNRDFNIVSSESISLSSGFVSEEYNEVFKQLMLSEKVWITNVLDTVEQVLPINVKTSNITYKTSLNDKLVEYTIEFDKSYDVINNIR